MTYRNVSPNAVYPLELGSDASLFVFDMLTSAGTDSLVTDGSTSVVTYSYTCPQNMFADLARVNIHLLDDSIEPSDFGGIAGSLTTGCFFCVTDSSGTITQAFDNWIIKNNGAWSVLAGTDIDRDTMRPGIPGDDSLTIRWTMMKAGVFMRLNEDENLKFVIRDDLTELSAFHMQVQGILRGT